MSCALIIVTTTLCAEIHHRLLGAWTLKVFVCANLRLSLGLSVKVWGTYMGTGSKVDLNIIPVSSGLLCRNEGAIIRF